MLLRGSVVSGMGNFSYWIEKLQEHYLRKTGMRFYPGTLNVRLDAPYSLPKRTIRLEASEYGGTVSVSMVPCVIRIPGQVIPGQIGEGRRFFCARMRMKKSAVIIRRRLWRSRPMCGCAISLG